MPDDVSSELDISGSGTPAVMVGNLDAEATSQAEAGHSVVVSMSVARETATNSAIAIALQDEAGELKTLDMLNISVSKSVDGAAATPIDETNNVIEIIVPYKFTGKEDIKVYRYHNNQAEALTEADTKADGTFRLDKTNGFIYIYTNKFSTYAIAFTQCYNINGTITYGSHSGSITLSLIDGNGSEIMNSNGDMNGGSYTLTHVPKGTYTMKATWTENGKQCSIEKEINVK
jgi:hypothetical protein